MSFSENSSTGIPLSTEFRKSIGKSWIYYKVSGSGPVCVIVPVTWGIDHTLYLSLSFLEKFLTLIYLDPRGVGKSGPAFPPSRSADPTQSEKYSDYSKDRLVEDLEEVRKELKSEKWIVFGHSSGGFTAQKYALKYPQSISKLILVCTAPSKDFYKGSIREIHHPLRKKIKTWADKFRQEKTVENYKPYLKKLYSEDLYDKKFSGILDSYIEKCDISMERYKYFGEVEMVEFDLRPFLSQIRLPVFISGSKHDHHVNYKQSLILNERIKNSRVHIFKKSGHFPWIEERKNFEKVIKEFVFKSS